MGGGWEYWVDLEEYGIYSDVFIMIVGGFWSYVSVLRYFGVGLF